VLGADLSMIDDGGVATFSMRVLAAAPEPRRSGPRAEPPRTPLASTAGPRSTRWEFCATTRSVSPARRPGLPPELPERTRELPAEEFPRLIAIGQQYALHLSDDAFELGLTLLLRGLRGELSGA
jgi:hypothetical protein